MVKDRVLVLEQLNPGKDTGMLDPRVFKGENALHLVMDAQTTMWRFRMEHGLVPAQLKNKYTDFKSAMRHAESYFNMKNIRIKEVIY